ncbi:DUF4383 domain-containing protein [Legionella oakridgensis]|uniref:DUF4383 domain-containing protein n=2 Tax=Legionella oakridgensis TaxID=29423 RepID=W0BHP5_9GAMM|nr:DUF4383 domain-containing protein [Legionella oakridgensis]AHE68152.1 hypothetical protein Loa_02615 [Legionella oakridgensis ATCC 33761 = DSM 21215]ETO92364.1 hypothetical protein LOR_77c22190 [Legionella oakridgensis RV-2-2007]KTD37279.1 hypothetical protein Loak_2415 [Legionella oakridgensis]STY21119.1 Uncharacterised protein [Legionella longbeachae]
MSIERSLAIIFGLVFILVGIAGFVPNLLTDGNLLMGLFMVDPIHNSVHLLSGIIALIAASTTVFSRLYFQIFGTVYGIVALIGFITGGNLIVMHMNIADNFLHLIIAVVALFIGFFMRRKMS